MADRTHGAALLLAAGTVLLAAETAGADGAAVYEARCQVCHQPGGIGAPGFAPPLRSDLIRSAASKAPDYVPLVILNGLAGRIEVEGKPLNGVMPPQPDLSDEEIEQVAAYVYGTLNDAGAGRSAAATPAAELRARPARAADLKRIRASLAP